MTQRIHQLYCTHCTYGTSYLHQRDGAVRDQSFEYSARAGSVPRERSHDYFRLLESYLDYRLPADMPDQDLLRLTAHTAPSRLIYYPVVAGLRVIAQVSYRATDSQGRPGSYFAHVLISGEAISASGRKSSVNLQPASAPSWSAADGLQLWASPSWQLEDANIASFELPQLESLEDFQNGWPPVVNEKVLHSFLTTPAGGDFDDPGGVIPERWRQTAVEQRQELLSDTLQGFLELNLAARQSMLLAVEPSLAALVFFGVCRLLPKSGLLDQLSFSTYEPSKTRPTTALAATMFHDPAGGDLPREAYQSRGFAINTFRPESPKLSWKSRNPAPRYARTLVEILVDEERSWPAVRTLLERLERAGAASKDDLEELLEADTLVASLASPGGTPPEAIALPRTNTGRRYLRQALGEQIAADMDRPQFAALCADVPRVVAVLKVIAKEDDVPANVAFAVDRLLRVLPENELGELLSANDVAEPYKRKALLAFVVKQSRLPRVCQWIWGNSRVGAAGRPVLLDSLVSELNVQQFQALLKCSLPFRPPISKDEQEVCVRAVCESLVEAAATDASKRESLADFVDHDERPVDALLQVLRSSPSLRQNVFGLYPQHRDILPALLTDVLAKLPEDPRNFDRSLEMLEDAEQAGLLPHSPQIAAWRGVRQLFQRIEHELSQSNSIWSRIRRSRQSHDVLGGIGAELAEAVAQAMPPQSRASPSNGRRAEQQEEREDRADVVVKLAAALLPSGAPPKPVLDRIRFGHKQKPRKPAIAARSPRRLPRIPLNCRTGLFASTAVLLLALGLGGFWMLSGQANLASRSDRSAATKSENQPTPAPPSDDKAAEHEILDPNPQSAAAGQPVEDAAEPPPVATDAASNPADVLREHIKSLDDKFLARLASAAIQQMPDTDLAGFIKQQLRDRGPSLTDWLHRELTSETPDRVLSDEARNKLHQAFLDLLDDLDDRQLAAYCRESFRSLEPHGFDTLIDFRTLAGLARRRMMELEPSADAETGNHELDKLLKNYKKEDLKNLPSDELKRLVPKLLGSFAMAELQKLKEPLVLVSDDRLAGRLNSWSPPGSDTRREFEKLLAGSKPTLSEEERRAWRNALENMEHVSLNSESYPLKIVSVANAEDVSALIVHGIDKLNDILQDGDAPIVETTVWGDVPDARKLTVTASRGDRKQTATFCLTDDGNVTFELSEADRPDDPGLELRRWLSFCVLEIELKQEPYYQFYSLQKTASTEEPWRGRLQYKDGKFAIPEERFKFIFLSSGPRTRKKECGSFLLENGRIKWRNDPSFGTKPNVDRPSRQAFVGVRTYTKSEFFSTKIKIELTEGGLQIVCDPSIERIKQRVKILNELLEILSDLESLWEDRDMILLSANGPKESKDKAKKNAPYDLYRESRKQLKKLIGEYENLRNDYPSEESSSSQGQANGEAPPKSLTTEVGEDGKEPLSDAEWIKGIPEYIAWFQRETSNIPKQLDSSGRAKKMKIRENAIEYLDPATPQYNDNLELQSVTIYRVVKGEIDEDGRLSEDGIAVRMLQINTESADATGR